MTRKLMIAAWSGPLPEWSSQWLEHIKPLDKFGWDFKLLLCEDAVGTTAARPIFNHLVFDTLGVCGQVQPGTRKICDYRPAFGVLFADMLKGYDFWGHVDLDCVYGRLDRWLPDSYLDTLDIFSNDPGAICGPFSLYRNIPRVNNLFFRNAHWEPVFAHPSFFGFDEVGGGMPFAGFGGITATVHRAVADGSIRFKSAFWQSHDKQLWHIPTPRIHLEPDGSLIDDGVPMDNPAVTFNYGVPSRTDPRCSARETLLFHFNRKDIPKRWPL